MLNYEDISDYIWQRRLQGGVEFCGVSKLIFNICYYSFFWCQRELNLLAVVQGDLPEK